MQLLFSHLAQKSVLAFRVTRNLLANLWRLVRSSNEYARIYLVCIFMCTSYSYPIAIMMYIPYFSNLSASLPIFVNCYQREESVTTLLV